MTITIVTTDDVKTMRDLIAQLPKLYWRATDPSTAPGPLEDIKARLRSYRAFAEGIRDKLDLDLRQERVPRPFNKWGTAYRFVSDIDAFVDRCNIALR